MFTKHSRTPIITGYWSPCKRSRVQTDGVFWKHFLVLFPLFKRHLNCVVVHFHAFPHAAVGRAPEPAWQIASALVRSRSSFNLPKHTSAALTPVTLISLPGLNYLPLWNVFKDPPRWKALASSSCHSLLFLFFPPTLPPPLPPRRGSCWGI